MGPPNRPAGAGLDRGPSGPSGEGIFYEVSRAESLPKRINAQDIKRRESDSIDTPDIKRRDSDKRDFEPDKWQFVGSLQDDSRAYRNLAMELIFLCRFFVQAHEQSSNSSIRLRKLLIAADDALRSAAKAGSKTSMRVDKIFVKAIHLLSSFEEDFPFTSDSNIGGMVAGEGKMNDKSESPSTILYSLKKNLHSKPMGNEWPRLTRVVEFHLLSSLPGAHPIIMRQVLSDSPSLQEILWNFSHSQDEKKRLTLTENPHFYAELPTSPEDYGDSLKIDPTEDFRHAHKFYVLVDNPELVHIMTDRVSQPFSNFWCPKDAVIFKDICGRLRGENIVKASLGGTSCGFCKRLPVSTVPRASRDRRGLQPIITEGCPWVGWKCSTGCLMMHSSVDIGLGVCTGRAEPDSPLLPVVPLAPTSERPGYSVAYRTHIDMLDNDSLLQIFSDYRLEHEENWNLQHTWRKLVHVCRRWRNLIYDSSSHLDMCLLLTNDSSSIDTLGHLPPLPLVIDYSDRTETIARKDEDNIHLGLQQHDLIRRVVLEARSSSLRMWLDLMNKLFPRLGDLCLFSTTVEEGNLMLPETLQAPDLRRLSLHGIGLPNGLSLLSSVTTLSTLSLTQIQNSCYFSPGDLVTQLQGLPHLEELSIGFAISTPLPSSEGEVLRAPILPVTLPTLRRLTFRGEDIYLDNLVAQVNTPLLERLSLTFVFDIAFTLVYLTEFIHRTEGFASGCPVSRAIFNKDGASINAGCDEQWDVGRLSLHVNCEPLDWQIDFATQVCSALGNVMSRVEDLTLDLDADGMPSDWRNPVDNSVWHELLIPFIGVKKLHIGSSITLELSQALESVAGGLVLELLPQLQELEVQLEIGHTQNVFSTFVKTRESAGHPIHLLTHRIEALDQISFPEHGSYNVRGIYRNQAINLISMCQTFIQAQEQTIRSYDKLRSVSRVVDDALKSATEAQYNTSSREAWRKADDKLKRAIGALRDYGNKFHSIETSAQWMEAAAVKDRSILIRLPLTMKKPKIMVEFLIHRSLLDPKPTIVKLVLDHHSGFSEVLWIFGCLRDDSKMRRLTLKRNPHFYPRLPTLPEAYGGNFRMEPIGTFQHERVSVLFDNPKHAGQVFLETARETRAFGNVWVPNETIIFKDVCGNLVGESIVEAAIDGIPNIWSFEESLRRPLPSRSPNRNNPSLTVTATQITSAEGILIRDWREPIRQMLQSRDVYVRITDKPPSSSSPSYSYAS